VTRVNAFAEVLPAPRGLATEKHVPLILIGVLECFFRVNGLAFVHYTCYRDGEKNTSISSCESNSIRRIKGERAKNRQGKKYSV